MNHLIQLEEKLDSIEFARYNPLTGPLSFGGFRNQPRVKVLKKPRRPKVKVVMQGDNVVSAKGKSGNPLDPRGKKFKKLKHEIERPKRLSKIRAEYRTQKRIEQIERASQNPKIRKQTRLAERLYDVIEFQNPGVDPSVIQQVVNDAQSMGQEGETRVAISQQLFQKLNLALQEFYANKNHVDSQIVQQAIKQ